MRKLREVPKNVEYLTQLTLRYKAKTIYQHAYLKIFNLFKYIFHNLHCNKLE